MPEIRCAGCRKPYPDKGVPYRCPDCGGMFNFDPLPGFVQANITPNQPGYWRYQSFFGLPEHAPVITLGEGNTPLLWVEKGFRKIALKMELLNPTGSYKDRGSAVLVSQLVAREVIEAIEDSSGNAGASFAAYAAAAGIKTRIFVPASASGPKRSQIEAYGAELIEIPGPRSEAARAVQVEADRGVPYASHAYMPFGIAGIATIAYEIWEQLEWQVPGTLIAPVGHGGLLIGIIRGFKALQTAGLIKNVPYWVGIQAEACDPLTQAFFRGENSSRLINIRPSAAEGVCVSNPSQAKSLLDELSGGKGLFHSIREEKILPAVRDLAHRGIHVEPTSALVWAALESIQADLPDPVVLILTGSGLKSTQVW
jgi:threonine synthase